MQKANIKYNMLIIVPFAGPFIGVHKEKIRFADDCLQWQSNLSICTAQRKTFVFCPATSVVESKKVIISMIQFPFSGHYNKWSFCNAMVGPKTEKIVIPKK